MAGLLIVADSIKSITGTDDGKITIQLTNGGIGTMKAVTAVTTLGDNGITIETTVNGTQIVIVTGASKDRKKKKRVGGVVMQTL